jgi:hypothetical protein
MTPTAVAERRGRTLTNGTLTALARTYDGVASSVWIHDLEGDCVYRNASARTWPEPPHGGLGFDILDHAGKPVGRLTLSDS